MFNHTAQKLTDKTITLHAAAASLPAPTGDAGAPVPWLEGSAPREFELTIDADGALTASAALLCARDAATAAWRVVKALNGGSDITTLTATLGYRERIAEDLTGVDRLAVFSALTGANATVAVTPIEVLG